MVTLKCKNCGKDYQTYKSHIKWRGSSYCSRDCGLEYRRNNKELFSGENSKSWRGGRRREKCKVCGIAISNWTKHSLCKPCFGKKNSGENNVHWKGIKRLRYHHLCWTKRYKDWRIKIFKKDNYECQECGRVGGYLMAHHIRFWATYPKERYKVSNGVTLCKDCHKYVHRFERLFEKSLKKYA